MNKFIITASNLGDIKPIVISIASKWGQLSDNTFAIETELTHHQIYNKFNLVEGSQQNLHIVGIKSPYCGFGNLETVLWMKQSYDN